MNIKFVLLALAAAVAIAQATCVDQVCRCASNAREVGSYAGGCYTCYCEALATSTAATTRAATTAAPTTRAATTAAATTAAPTTARATTAAATTAAPRAQCPTFAACRCKDGSSSQTAFDDNGCPFCFCQADTAASTAAPATTRAATTAAPATTRAATAGASTAAATTARATTAAPTTARATTARCGALPECGCSTSEVTVYSTDANGCPSSCQCQPAPSTARASTAAPTTVRATSAASTCPAAQPCACFRNDDIQTWVTDSKGCRSCVCVAAPTTTVAPATTRATTTTPSCAPWALRDNCNCAPGTVKYYRTDAWGCLVCGCQAVTTIAPTTRATTRATTAAPTTARATTAAATTARATTAAPTTARATTPASSGSCGTVRQCKCQAGAVVMWDIDSNGCPSCYCAAAGSAATGADAAASDSSSSSSSSTSAVVVPIAAAVGCVGTLFIAVVAIFRFKSKNGRFPWVPAETSVEASV